LTKGIRLSCQALVLGDCVCTVLPEYTRQAPQIMEQGESRDFPLDPDLRKIVVQVPDPLLGRKYFDAEALQAAIPGVVRNRTSNLALLRCLPSVLRHQGRQVTVILDEDELVGVEPGDTSDRLYGIAADIGTTTVVVKLLDLSSGQVKGTASALNAQESYGADVITRVKHVIEEPDGLATLYRLFVEQLNELTAEVCAKAGVSTNDVYKVVIAGNTIMQHLALAIDPRHLAAAPYTPVLQGPARIAAPELGFSINRSGLVYVLPHLACYVGGDISAVLTTLHLEESDQLQLVVDIGTNGETVLGSRQRLVCCSSPAGPAWEGASIVWGMRASYGAIERVDVVDDDLAFRTIGNAAPLGICGSGLMDLLALLVRAGIVDSTGRLLLPQELKSACPKLVSRIVGGPGGASFRIAPIEDSWIELTQRDIRELQLAKSAIASAIRMLMGELQIEASDIDQVYIAGAFGNHIRGQDAIDIGLLPWISPDRIRFIGNAAVAGAEAVLRSRGAREKAERLAHRVEYVELAGRPDFQEEFASGLLFPER
jgi:uncharacterized 2Fe-2S/4Fe-4S cluster protein (DUF4445 family)